MKYVYELEYTSEVNGKIEQLNLHSVPLLYSSKKKCLYEIECQRAWHIQNADKFRIKDVSAISEVEFNEQEKSKTWVYRWTVTFLCGNKITYDAYIIRRVVH